MKTSDKRGKAYFKSFLLVELRLQRRVAPVMERSPNERDCMHDTQPKTHPRRPAMNHVEFLVADPRQKCDYIRFPRQRQDQRRQRYGHQARPDTYRGGAVAAVVAIVGSLDEGEEGDVEDAREEEEEEETE